MFHAPYLSNFGISLVQHDFQNMAASYDEFDQQAKIQSLHDLRPRVAHTARPQLLPPSLWEKYRAYNVWENDPRSLAGLNWISPTSLAEKSTRPAKPPTGRQL